MRKLLLIFVLFFSISFCLGQQSERASMRLMHLPLDAPALEITKFINKILEYDSNPFNYLSIVSTLDTIAQQLSPYAISDSLPLKKFVADLHLLDEATNLINLPYDGQRIKSVTDLIPNVTFFSNSQRENLEVDSVFTSLRQYYGITTNLQELLQDIINGQENYIKATSDGERNIVISQLEEAISFDVRNKRISRIPYLKMQFDTILSACPRDENNMLLPQSFDLNTLKNIYESNEAVRLTREAEQTSKNKATEKHKLKD